MMVAMYVAFGFLFRRFRIGRIHTTSCPSGVVYSSSVPLVHKYITPRKAFLRVIQSFLVSIYSIRILIVLLSRAAIKDQDRSAINYEFFDDSVCRFV